MLNMRKCTIVPMLHIDTQEVEFELLIYGYSSAELMTVPNEVINSLARRYPDHYSDVLLLRDSRPIRGGMNFFSAPPAKKAYKNPYFKKAPSSSFAVKGYRDDDGNVIYFNE